MRLQIVPIAVCLFFFVAAPSAQSDTIIASSRVVNAVTVREGPSADSAALGRLTHGVEATLLVAIPNWYHVRLPDSTEGFVSKAWTTRQPAAPAPPAAASDPAFTVHFLDVGTGDAAVIDIGEREIIIDGGNSPTVLRDYLAARDIIDGPIELVIVTHGDTDHWKGLSRLMNFDGLGATPPRVLEFWDAGYDRDCNGPGHSGRQGISTSSRIFKA